MFQSILCQRRKNNGVINERQEIVHDMYKRIWLICRFHVFVMLYISNKLGIGHMFDICGTVK